MKNNDESYFEYCRAQQGVEMNFSEKQMEIDEIAEDKRKKSDDMKFDADQNNKNDRKNAEQKAEIFKDNKFDDFDAEKQEVEIESNNTGAESKDKRPANNNSVDSKTPFHEKKKKLTFADPKDQEVYLIEPEVSTELANITDIIDEPEENLEIEKKRYNCMKCEEIFSSFSFLRMHDIIKHLVSGKANSNKNSMYNRHLAMYTKRAGK
jgi:hypothetical protein